MFTIKKTTIVNWQSGVSEHVVKCVLTHLFPLLFISLFLPLSLCQCVGEENWVDSRTVYIGHKEPPPGAEAYIPQRYPDNRIVSSKVASHRPWLSAAILFVITAILSFVTFSQDDTFYCTCVIQAVRSLATMCHCSSDLCDDLTVHLLELHPQEPVWAVQKNR